MTTCVSSVNTHTVYWPQWRFLVVLNADLEQFWVQAGVRRVHFLRLSGWVPIDRLIQDFLRLFGRAS
jgi:hypothetical protein